MHDFYAKTTGVFEENDALKAKNENLSIEAAMLRMELQKSNSDPRVIKIKPEQIVRSEWANRHEQSFADKEFQALKSEIESAGGNIQPIKIRPIEDEPDKYQIVFGHRRHQACLELGLPVSALIEQLDDRDLFTQMDRENRSRKDLRPYEQGMMYRRALDKGLFTSARQMAELVGADQAGINKSLAIAKLPDFVLLAFDSPMDIQVNWAYPLRDAVDKNRIYVVNRSKLFQSENPRPKPSDIFKALTAKEPSESEIRPGQSIDEDKHLVKSAYAPESFAAKLIEDVKLIQPDRYDELMREIDALIARFK